MILSLQSESGIGERYFSTVMEVLSPEVEVVLNKVDNDVDIFVCFSAIHPAIEKVKNMRAKKVLIQHAFEIDSMLSMGVDLSFFDLVLVGDEHTYNQFRQIYPEIRCVYTGLPILDNLFSIDYKPTDYYVATSLIVENELGRYFSDEFSRYYYTQLPKLVNYPILFNRHPHQEERFQGPLYETRTVKDDMFKLLSKARALISNFSFAVVEASLLGVPVISHPYVDPDTVRQIRTLGEAKRETYWLGYDYNSLGCRLDNIHYTDNQKTLASKYLSDGAASLRVASLIEELL